jgi:catechol 2,3-dioxygenase-like lactoylglutathione lyase family enzyme
MSDESLVGGLTFRIDHTMLPVADLDRSIDFYTRLLGMKGMGRRLDEIRKVEQERCSERRDIDSRALRRHPVRRGPAYAGGR